MNQISYKKMSSKLRRTISYARFTKLKELAQNTVGTENSLTEFQLNNYLSLYQTLDTMIQSTDTLILEEFSHKESYLQTIPGIGPISAATIMSEIEDINKFSNPNQLVAYSGLDPTFINLVKLNSPEEWSREVLHCFANAS